MESFSEGVVLQQFGKTKIKEVDKESIVGTRQEEWSRRIYLGNCWQAEITIALHENCRKSLKEFKQGVS